jgi:hypothetical protein
LQWAEARIRERALEDACVTDGILEEGGEGGREEDGDHLEGLLSEGLSFDKEELIEEKFWAEEVKNPKNPKP